MELENKPRGIAIPEVAFLLTRNISGTFSAGSVPIRAPLTVDDEDESSSDSRGDDDDGFGTVSGDADYETELEEEVFAVDDEEETSLNYSSLEEEESDNSESEDGVKAKVVIPRASLSLDDDESLGSDEEEEAAFVRVGVAEAQAPSEEETKGPDRTLESEDSVAGIGSVVGEFEHSPTMGLSASSKQLNALRKPCDVEGVQDDAAAELPQCLGSVFSEQDMVPMKSSQGNSLVVVPGDFDRGLDETFEEGVAQESISKESSNTSDNDSICEADELLIPGEKESVGLGSIASGVEDTGTLIGYSENDCSATSNLEKPECEGDPVISMSSKLTPTLDSVMTRSLEAAEEAGNVVKQESEGIDSSFETANGGQVSEQIDKQVNIQPDWEPDEISVGIGKASLLSAKDIERSMPENETMMAREKLSESTCEELSSNHSVQLISKKVKERVEKAELLKAKIQRIIGTMDPYSDTEAESKLSLSGGEHQTSLGLVDHVSLGTKVMLPADQQHLSVNILVIGKTGVGKSATVNSIFGETKSPVGAFGVTTKYANYVVGNVGGILVRILDTPGLMSSATEERFNQQVLTSIKKSMRQFPVDTVLYVDRADDNPDIHLLRIVTTSLGSSIWRNTIVVLTHAASSVLDYSSYEDFVAQRSSYMHQSIRQAVPELSCEMPGIVLAENNNMSCFYGDKSSESVSPDWRLNLLILCCSVKIQSKADSLQTVQEKAGVFGSIKLLCTLWSLSCHSHDRLKEKKVQLLGSYPKDELSHECLEQDMFIVKNQEPGEGGRRHDEKGKGNIVGGVRRRSGGLGFQATKGFGIYLDMADLQTGFSFGNIGYRKDGEGRRKMLLSIRGSMHVFGLVPMLLMSVFTSVFRRKNI